MFELFIAFVVIVVLLRLGFGPTIAQVTGVLARVGLFIACACIIAVIALAIWSAQPARPSQVSYHQAPATVEPGLTIAEQDARYRSAAQPPAPPQVSQAHAAQCASSFASLLPAGSCPQPPAPPPAQVSQAAEPAFYYTDNHGKTFGPFPTRKDAIWRCVSLDPAALSGPSYCWGSTWRSDTVQTERTDVYQQSLQILSGEKLAPLN